MEHFFETNQWASKWLPGCNYRSQRGKDPHPNLFKKFMEWVLNSRLGNYIENYLMRLTQRRWKRKEAKGKLNPKGLPMELITGKHFARSNPGAFQEKVLALYDQKLAKWERAE